MGAHSCCPECGAQWREGLTCRDHFDQMLAWEFENPGGAGAVHHLTVLCYNLQHPSVYSPEGLRAALEGLVQFVVLGKAPADVRRQNRRAMDQGNRSYRITGGPTSHGEYACPVNWSITVADVAPGGLDGYCDRVWAWSKAVYQSLKESGNLT